MIEKYLTGEASNEEMLILDSWFDNFNTGPSLIASLSSVELEKVSSKMFRAISANLNKNTED